MTETNAIGTSIAGADYLAHPASSGRVSGVLDIRIVDEAGVAQPANTRGELQIRGASIMRGYWNRPDANADTFVDGWMRTGDVAYVDDEGFVYIVDRIKDLVIRGGENIGCGSVEAALLEHPEVIEASVYGVPDERLGEEVGATIYARSAIDEAELRAFLAPRLARFEIPAISTSPANPCRASPREDFEAATPGRGGRALGIGLVAGGAADGPARAGRLALGPAGPRPCPHAARGGRGWRRGRASRPQSPRWRSRGWGGSPGCRPASPGRSADNDHAAVEGAHGGVHPTLQGIGVTAWR
uniref:Long-chain fatty acid--CoA ligase n=1 Tax=Phenylobacterium glaciei TaxID=2803784 RepID=A0A974S950_9CAUL|nr:long-chain fatty acid--CoA ligase [Phenylobacterium glaciei]